MATSPQGSRTRKNSSNTKAIRAPAASPMTAASRRPRGRRPASRHSAWRSTAIATKTKSAEASQNGRP